MPTFDFQCAKCSEVFEFSRPFGKKTMPACPACKSKKVTKLLTPPNIQFKGTGFYKTDSRPQPKKTEKPKTPEKSETTAKEAKTEPKPQEKKPSNT